MPGRQGGFPGQGDDGLVGDSGSQEEGEDDSGEEIEDEDDDDSDF